MEPGRFDVNARRLFPGGVGALVPDAGELRYHAAPDDFAGFVTLVDRFRKLRLRMRFRAAPASAHERARHHPQLPSGDRRFGVELVQAGGGFHNGLT